MYYSVEKEILCMITRYPKFINKSNLNKNLFSDKYKPIFKAIVNCYEKNNDIVLPVIFESLGEQANFLIDILQSDCFNNEDRFKTLENILIENYKENKLKSLCENYFSNKINRDVLLNEINDLDRYKMNTYNNLTKESLLDSLINSKNTNIRLLNYPKISSLINLNEHDFVVIGAETGKGKTAFALNLLNDLSKRYNCIYLNLEMELNEFQRKLIAINSDVELWKIENFNDLSPGNKSIIEKNIEEIATRNISVINSQHSLDSIKSILYSLDSKKHSIIFIDHMHLINMNNSMSRYEKFTTIATTLRTLSLNCNITIIALCQLNRESKKELSAPKLSSIKESGEIENSASKVMFLYTDENRKYKMLLAKNRNGRTGEIELNFNGSKQIIKEV